MPFEFKCSNKNCMFSILQSPDSISRIRRCPKCSSHLQMLEKSLADPQNVILEIFNKQLALNKAIGTDLHEAKMSDVKREQLTSALILSSHSELNEVLDLINWKYWKKTRVEYDANRIFNIQQELIDILHFWTGLAILWDITPYNLLELYEYKNKINLSRQKNSY